MQGMPELIRVLMMQNSSHFDTLRSLIAYKLLKETWKAMSTPKKTRFSPVSKLVNLEMPPVRVRTQCLDYLKSSDPSEKLHTGSWHR